MPALETLKKELEAAYPSVKIQVTRCDVTMKGDNLALVAKAQVRDLVETGEGAEVLRIQEVFGAVDIFIANAGVMPLTLLKNVRLEEWCVFSGSSGLHAIICLTSCLLHLSN